MKRIIAKFAIAGVTLVGMAMATANLGPAAAQTRVGVAAGTSGDPLGKPPGETERILRVGTDVQANEVVTTRENDRAHLLFLDGTSLTVGPNAQLMIDKFVYDPASQKGELAINATKGVFRLIGGKISKNNAITVNTPSSTMGIRGGIMIFGVGTTQTTSIFIFGTSMTVTAAGVTQTVTVPSSQVQTSQGSAPGAPTAIPPGSLGGVMGALVASTQGANAAVVAAITTAIAANLNNAAVLASLVALAQSVLAGQALTTTTTAGGTISLIPVNPQQAAQGNNQQTGSAN
jgi:FecR protein